MRRAFAYATLVLALFAACESQAQLMYTYASSTPAVATMSDEDLEYTVAKALKEDDSLRGSFITLRIVDHRIVLEGVALSREQAQQARAVAENAVGPELVVTEIEIAR